MEKLRWEPTTSEERVHLWIARRDRKSLEKDWPNTLSVMLTDLYSKELARVRNAVFAGISIGNVGFVPEAEAFLEKAGTKDFAEVFLNCGERQLHAAAQRWATAHGYEIRQGFGSSEAGWRRM